MRHDDNVCLPPPHLLEALRQPRGAQLSEMLTPSEIASLRQRAKETSAFAQKAFTHLRPQPQTASKAWIKPYLRADQATAQEWEDYEDRNQPWAAKT